jgi:membrane associated rhomboid family serine protease
MSVLIGLVVINVVVSVLGFRAFQDPSGEHTKRFLFIPHDVARGENGVGMLLSHFAHGSLVHLMFNMIALYSFAGTVLDILGPVKFLLIYVAAGCGSDLLVFALRKDDPGYRCLGASGSVFGIVMAAVVLRPDTSVMLFLVPVPIPGPIFMLGYAIISIVLIARKHRGRISHEGHLGGALIGLAVTGVTAPRGLDPLFRWFAQWL